MCRIPDPAVIHCVAPSVISPPPPWESWWAIRPSSMYQITGLQSDLFRVEDGQRRRPRLRRGVGGEHGFGRITALR